LISDIKSSYPNAKVNIITIKLDLSSLESTKAAAEAIISQTSRLDILFNNAGIALVAPALTKDGYETQFGVNYVGHALFTQLLLPLMLQTASTAPPKSVRIVNISSQAHVRTVPNGLALDEAKTDMAAHHSAKRYGHSKVANILFAQKVAQLYPSITSVSLHPGFVATEINTGKGGGSFWLGLLIRNIVGWVGLSVEDGTKTQLWCGVAPEVESGKYYEPIGVVKAGSKWVQDETKREELWQWTEKELKAHGGPGWPEIK
jgi:NAD(P)-dependent dehydrogenase (short-subunit alcohol dehydrogenase family)